MEFIFRELVDIPRLQAILNDLNNISDLPTSIFDIDGKRLVDSGRKELCSRYYRSKPETNLQCDLNSLTIVNKVINDSNYIVHTCMFGITSIGSPIVVNGKTIAVIIMGEFFLEEPKVEPFIEHVKCYGFDEEGFMQAIKKVPVMTIEKALSVVRFVEKFAEMIADMSLTNFMLKKKDEIISRTNAHLESLVNERTSQLTEANKLLKASMNKYKLLINNLPCAVMITDPKDDKIIYANSETSRIFGTNSKFDVIGKKISDIFVFDDRVQGRRDEQVKFILEHGYKPVTIENLIRKSDNKTIQAETSSNIINYDGNTYVLVLIRDNTERLEALELQKNIAHQARMLNEIMEYDKLKTEFLANISHELRTPINIIFCSLQMLSMYANERNHPKSTNINKHIGMMKQNSYRLIRLIDNLIDITKIENGSFKLNLVNANIISIIENITNSIKDYGKSKDLSIIFTSNTEKAITACDPDKIERIILNLLSNSIKFTPPTGTIAVDIFTKQGITTISVKDTGIGIPADKRHTVFERFSQLDRSLSRHHEGSGIGLSLVKSLVEMHKGKIYINESYCTGCEIIIELPLVISSDTNNELINKNLGNNIERFMIEFSDIYL